MDLAIGEDDSRLGGILNRPLRLPVLACDAAYRAAQMIAGQVLHILDLEGLDVQIVQLQESDCVLDVESHDGKGTHEVLPFLEGAGFGGVV